MATRRWKNVRVPCSWGFHLPPFFATNPSLSVLLRSFPVFLKIAFRVYKQLAVFPTPRESLPFLYSVYITRTHAHYRYLKPQCGQRRPYRPPSLACRPL